MVSNFPSPVPFLLYVIDHNLGRFVNSSGIFSNLVKSIFSYRDLLTSFDLHENFINDRIYYWGHTMLDFEKMSLNFWWAFKKFLSNHFEHFSILFFIKGPQLLLTLATLLLTLHSPILVGVAINVIGCG